MKLPTWGITCLELTGDNESCNTKNIHESNISLTTLEKFEVMTRREARDGWLGFFSDISLVLSDEVHLLNDPHRATLEVVVSKLKMLSWSKEMTSSPLANFQPPFQTLRISQKWFFIPSESIKRFGEERSAFKTLFFLYILIQYSRGKFALIFYSTRKGAQEGDTTYLSDCIKPWTFKKPFIRSNEQKKKKKFKLKE
ncbi:hypothetical protein IEQ34_001167 [Dendrobium chrysotoxum]|uniref:Uncharacterized protein n=1 Tax=Dendrobium chrysotoxum TaxID=161865 RepID=A0AAV7HP97_DENCH|nr:hypothetical protein IEQ34_001167 [Dendrobium chrysotoxum]